MSKRKGKLFQHKLTIAELRSEIINNVIVCLGNWLVSKPSFTIANINMPKKKIQKGNATKWSDRLEIFPGNFRLAFREMFSL